MVAEKFQIYGVKVTGNTFVSQKIESVHFYSCPQQNLPPGFYHYTPGRRELPNPPEQHFFPSRKGEGERIIELKKIIKIKTTKVLVTSFAKFCHLWNLYIFGFCFVVP